jgi:hypothetical protein
MENILQGVADSSSIPQDMQVFVSLCVEEGLTTGSSLSPYLLQPSVGGHSTWSHSSQGG